MKKVFSIALMSAILFFSVTFCFEPISCHALSVSDIFDISSYVDSNFSSYDDKVKGHINIGLNTAVSSFIELTNGNKDLAKALSDSMLGSLQIDTSISTQTTLSFNIGSSDDTYSVIVPEDGDVEFYHHSHGGGGGKNRVSSGNDLVTSGKVFSDYIDKVNSYYQPQEGLNYISWQTDPILKSSYYDKLSFFQDSELFCGKGWNECYALGFVRDGDTEYYCKYLYHFYLTTADNGDINYHLDIYSYDSLNREFLLNETPSKSFTLECTRNSYPYFDIFAPGCYDYGVAFYFYKNRTDWLSQVSDTTKTCNYSNVKYYSDIYGNEMNTYNSYRDYAYGNPANSPTKDFGYYVSDSPIKMTKFGDIETTHIPDNYYVTLGGDTVYDYSITNTSGDTTTINNYITNNYTIPETQKPDTDSGSSGGSSSGNITVGGNIDVSGNVDVGLTINPIDINVNVNDNGGSGSDISSDNKLDISDDIYLEAINENSGVVKSLLQGFFDFVPPEILGLILAALSVAVLCRLLGR